MRALKRVCAAAALAAALAATEASAGPPAAGVLVPGRSLGGVELGWTQAQVERAWGRAYGRCRSCPRPTLYFNLFAYRPEGAGVELRRGRVDAVFTVWAPGAWSTKQGLDIGDHVARVTSIYGPLERTPCDGYYALTIPSARAVTAIYVVGTEVWGFGLLDRRAPVCR